MITDAMLKEWEALCDAATPGPWERRRNAYGNQTVGPAGYSGHLMPWIASRHDGDFIAASREALPLLIAEVRRLREKS